MSFDLFYIIISILFVLYCWLRWKEYDAIRFIYWCGKIEDCNGVLEERANVKKKDIEIFKGLYGVVHMLMMVASILFLVL